MNIKGPKARRKALPGGSCGRPVDGYPPPPRATLARAGPVAGRPFNVEEEGAQLAPVGETLARPATRENRPRAQPFKASGRPLYYSIGYQLDFTSKGEFMARRPRHYTPESFMGAMEPDPIADAVFTDTVGVAGELGEFLATLREFDVSSIKAMLYRKPPSGVGAFAYLGVVPVPIHMDQVMEHLKAEYGGGDYRVTIFAGGKTRKHIEFPIYGPPKPVRPHGETLPSTAGDMKPTDMFAMMLQMQETSRREAAEARREALEQQRIERDRDRDRQSAMWQAVGVIAPVLVPALFNREKLGDLLAIMNANKTEGSNLKDTVETVVLLKNAFGEKSEGFDPQDMAGSLARLVGPVASGIGQAFRGARPTAPAEEPAPAYEGELQLPPPAPAQDPAAGGPSNPLVRLIAPHVTYFYRAQLPPDLAADALVDIMDRAGVTEGQVNELVAGFTLTADWKADLAAQGLDLRGNPGWADDLLNELVAAWTERGGNGHDSAGRGGGMEDAEANAQAGPTGLALDGDQATSA